MIRLELRHAVLATPGARDARRRWPERQRLLLRLTDGFGRFGLGEATPLPGYGTDTLEAAAQALERVDAAELERHLDGPCVFAALTAVSQLVPPTVPSARMALETAALDWLARREQVPAPTLLGARAGASVELSFLAGTADDPELLPRVQAARAEGYRCFKLKLGAPQRLAEETNGILRLRQALGPAPRLRLDANGALTCEQTAQAWACLRDAGVELFEEPGALPPDLRGVLPLALDESLQGLSENDVEARLVAERPAALVLKPTALGGLMHCHGLARRAREAGVAAVLSHCFEGELAWRATMSLALALDGSLAHGLGPYAGLRAPALTKGRIATWSEPGLGVYGELE